MGFLAGKKALIVGLASNRSMAYGITEAFHREGAEIALTYQNERLKDRVEKMGKDFDVKHYFPCDVSLDEEIENLFTLLSKEWKNFDILVHSVAFAPGDQLEGDYLDCVNREGFRIAHDVSSYSFAALAKAARPYINEGGALVTLSYLGAEKAIVNYNVMGVAKASLEANTRYIASSYGPKGIRVNAISAGPVRTLAASGIKSFRRMLDFNKQVAPLRENITIQQVGNAAAFLCSDLASGITGEVLHVDAGFNTVGVADNVMEQSTSSEKSEA